MNSSREHLSLNTPTAVASDCSVVSVSQTGDAWVMDLPDPIRRRLGDFSRTVFVDQTHSQLSTEDHVTFLNQSEFTALVSARASHLNSASLVTQLTAQYSNAACVWSRRLI